MLPYLALARATVLSHTNLLIENATLRQQLEIYRRQPKPPQLLPSDRLFWIWLSHWWARWQSALVIVSPETVLRWHREGYRRHWRRVSAGSPGRPPLPRNTIAIIQRISRDHPEWGVGAWSANLDLTLPADFDLTLPAFDLSIPDFDLDALLADVDKWMAELPTFELDKLLEDLDLPDLGDLKLEDFTLR